MPSASPQTRILDSPLAHNPPLQNFTTKFGPHTYDLEANSLTYTTDLLWNRVSDQEHSGPKRRDSTTRSPHKDSKNKWQIKSIENMIDESRGLV
ncbi:hypothetical protein AVEN_210826-1 [Araneus ventricosus]|uniref:Uncharacterized protein n=1 Tax=Araneus ventricosus TaxID=182803 RepID=A0A4Y2WI70_ARAVE|nr:hypothetical protein AVEN_210826-1 [Araneus ventricosus]